MKRSVRGLLLLCALAASGFACGANPIVTTTSSGAIQIIAAGKTIRICSVVFQVSQSASPVDFSLVTGTGTNCGTGQAQLTQVFYGSASIIQVYSLVYGDSSPLNVVGNTAVCLLLSGVPTKASAQVSYEYF